MSKCGIIKKSEGKLINHSTKFKITVVSHDQMTFQDFSSRGIKYTLFDFFDAVKRVGHKWTNKRCERSSGVMSMTEELLPWPITKKKLLFAVKKLKQTSNKETF